MRKKEREITELPAIESLIQECDVCRIAFADGNTPYIVTMNFGYEPGEPGRFYFHCAPEGRKLRMLEKNNYVCFELDTSHQIYGGEAACDWGTRYRSVVGYGLLSIITGIDEKKRALDLIMTHYSGKGTFSYKPEVLERTCILTLLVTELSGKEA